MRYDKIDTCGGHCAEMEPAKDGDWMLYSDVLPLIEAARSLERRGFFLPSMCADAETATDMAAMRFALAKVIWGLS